MKCEHVFRLVENRITENRYELGRDGVYQINSSLYTDGWLKSGETVQCVKCKAEWKGKKAERLYKLLESNVATLDKIPEPDVC